MRTDLHNHTQLCKHAEGSMADFIERAIREKIDIFGFSDHAPMHFDPKYRMGFDQMEAYEAQIASLQERYGDKITILTGYEVDFLPGYMDERILSREVDYLIGSIHFLGEWGFDNPEFIGVYNDRDINDVWREYFNGIEKMAKSRLFDIVGHLDLIKIFKFLPTEDISSEITGALEAIRENGMVLEVNGAGLRKKVKETYPSLAILKEAKAMGIDICFGSDAHRVDEIGYGYEASVRLAKEAGYARCAIFRNRKKELINF